MKRFAHPVMATMLLLLTLCPGGAWAGTSPAVSRDTTVIEVNFNEITGKFNSLSGVQGSPYPDVPGDTEKISLFKASHIELCRFPQDCPPNTLTLAALFPDENADPDRAGSYRFDAIDRHILAARDAGCDILWQASYDVGMSDLWKGINLGGRAPRDMVRWCRVVRRCLEHFNNRWAGGYGHTVRYIEFINEPDGLGGFNGPEASRLLPAFTEFLKAIEEYNREHPATPVKAVGPGIPFSFERWEIWEPRFRKLFTHLRKSGITLPVFSFHTYGRDVSPGGNAKLARALRGLLDEYGMKTTELWNSEWQGGDFLREQTGLKKGRAPRDFTEEELGIIRRSLATYALSCKIRWQGTVDRSCYYRVSKRAFPPGTEERMPLKNLDMTAFFLKDGSLTPLAWQEKIAFSLKKDTPLWCRAGLSRDNGLITILGTRSESGDRMALILCNLSTSTERIEVSFIPPSPRETLSVQVFPAGEEKPIRHVPSLHKPGPGSRHWSATFEAAPLNSYLVLIR